MRLSIYAKFAFMFYVDFLEIAQQEFAELPAEMRARLIRMVEVIEQHGLRNAPGHWVKSLGGGLWELRVTGRDGIARAFFVVVRGPRMVIVRVFIKKTQKTPKHELKLAWKRAKEVE